MFRRKDIVDRFIVGHWYDFVFPGGSVLTGLVKERDGGYVVMNPYVGQRGYEDGKKPKIRVLEGNTLVPLMPGILFIPTSREEAEERAKRMQEDNGKSVGFRIS